MSKWKVEVAAVAMDTVIDKEQGTVKVPRDVVKHITVFGAENKKEAEEAATRRMGKKADGHKGIKSFAVDDNYPNAGTHVDLTPPVCHSCGRPLQEVTT